MKKIKNYYNFIFLLSLIFCISCICSTQTNGDESTACNDTTTLQNNDAVKVTVIDVGAGLCCIMELPNNKYIIYDGGNKSAMDYIRNKIPQNIDIELLVLSHTDADHWGITEFLVSEYEVKNILWTEYRATSYSQTYGRGLDSIKAIRYEHTNMNLSNEGTNIQPGDILYDKNGVKLYFVCGFGEPLDIWNELNSSKKNNAVSIVVKLEYHGKSILICGDAVGREDCQIIDDCIATEKYMVDNVPDELIDSDVIVAPHHGADNSSCDAFINEVSPEYVVFSSGHRYRHPRYSTAKRYLDYGVELSNIFRTDRGDHEDRTGEECEVEWDYLRIQNHNDPIGDDDVLINLSATGEIEVKYIND